MSRSQREKSQARSLATEKHSGKWMMEGYRDDAEKSLERRRKRNAYSKNKYAEKYSDFF